MRDRPILFNGEMVRAILAGRKTQTRRVVKTGLTEFSTRDIGGGCTETIWSDEKRTLSVGGGGDTRAHALRKVCPFGQPGDRLWVREAWASVPCTAFGFDREKYPLCWGVSEPGEPNTAIFKAGWDRCVSWRWRPSIHMPRWASRITLEITGVRVERLQEISEGDARAEGVQVGKGPRIVLNREVAAFANLWDHVAKPGQDWAANPWTWVIEFRRI